MTQSNKYYMSFRVIEHYVMDIGRPTGSPLPTSWEIVLRALRVFVVQKKLTASVLSVSSVVNPDHRATQWVAPTRFMGNRSLCPSCHCGSVTASVLSVSSVVNPDHRATQWVAPISEYKPFLASCHVTLRVFVVQSPPRWSNQNRALSRGAHTQRAQIPPR